jgi:hypothetical protein
MDVLVPADSAGGHFLRTVVLAAECYLRRICAEQDPVLAGINDTQACRLPLSWPVMYFVSPAEAGSAF